MTLPPETRIGPYHLKGLLGAGGMGEVYRAHDERLRRDVALKLMTAATPGDASRFRRMEQEARAAGSLSHPNILGVFDVGVHDDRMYVVTELLEGESLRAVVARGPVPWRATLGLAVQIVEGLAAAHERGIVHRDIKPDNVFLTRDGRVKVLDFGVATWRASPTEALATADAATMSQTGMLVGTVGYMSPEQARGRDVDHRSDLFACGCLFYELLSATPAFGGGTPLETLVAIQRDAPRPLQDLAPSVPDDLVRIVDRCLEKDPAKRFPSARELLFALTLIPTARTTPERTALVPVTSDGATPPPPPRFGPRIRLAMLLLPVFSGGGAVALGARRALVRPAESPLFRQMTFRRGTVYTARFSVDGSGIVYSAEWDGQPRELFASVPGTRDARPLGQPESDAAHFLATGELHVIRRSHGGFSSGVLARLSLAGGPAKDLLDGITWADGTPDGSKLLVVRRTDGRATLELPAGHPIADAPVISYPRISPDGARVAFLEADDPGEDSGRVVVVDGTGRRIHASPVWKNIEGLAWRSDAEVWFGASKEGRSLGIQATDLTGRTRLLCRVPGRLVLHDLYADGRVLAERNSYRCTLLAGSSSAQERERDVSWQDYSQLAQLSRDGKMVLFSEDGDGAGAFSTTYLRSLAGGLPLRLGEGRAMSLSADGTRALVRIDDGGAHLAVIPVGPGRSETLPRGRLVGIRWAAFAGATRIAILGTEAGAKSDTLFVQDLSGGDPRPLALAGLRISGDAMSPDGRSLAARQNGKTVIVALEGGPARELRGLDDHAPVGWTTDGASLFVRGGGGAAVQLSRYDLASGKLESVRRLGPTDPAGVLEIGRIGLARDGEVHVYESYRLLSDLYVIENLR